MHNKVLYGRCEQVLAELPPDIVQTTVTSPPYWTLRDYNMDGQIGLERTVDEYVGNLCRVFEQVHRVTRQEGTLWLNLGDTYNAYNGNRGPSRGMSRGADEARPKWGRGQGLTVPTLTNKNLLGLPWRVAFALQQAGWVLRNEIIWYKTHSMPERVKDRCKRAHETIFLFSKQERYFFNKDEIKDDLSRTVWSIEPESYSGAHFAVFPSEIPRRCVRLSTAPGDLVLDPFAGSGTTLAVAKATGREYLGVELNPAYQAFIEARLEAK